VVVESEDLDEETDRARAAGYGQRPTVASGVLDGCQHETKASDVDEFELVEVKHDELLAIAEPMKAFGERRRCGEVEVALNLDPRAWALSGFNDVQGWRFGAQGACSSRRR
jgi:hypothetical protein